MNLLNALLTTLFDWLLTPLAAWPALSLVLLSTLLGVLMAWVFGRTSNQAALRDASGLRSWWDGIKDRPSVVKTTPKL